MIDNKIALEKNIRNNPVQIVIEPSRGFVPINLTHLWQYRELIYFLVWRDIKIRYKQTALGVIWVILQPVQPVNLPTLGHIIVLINPSK